MKVSVIEPNALVAYFTIEELVPVLDNRHTIELSTCFVDMAGDTPTGIEILGPQDPKVLLSDLSGIGLEQDIIDLVIATLPNAWMQNGKV